MEYIRQSDGSTSTFVLKGRFTFSDYQLFGTLLEEIMREQRRNFVLDLAQIEFVDSAALGMLLIADDEVKRRNSSLTLRRPAGQVRRTFDLACLDKLLRIEK